MIWDCFTLFNELDVLEMRLEELDNVVGLFVIAEAPVTHSGLKKPLYFLENAHRFHRWRHRIVHLIVDDMPNNTNDRERHQRDALYRALGDASNTDGVMISDLDEIPNPLSVLAWTPDKGVCAFHQRLSYYWLNCCEFGGNGTKIAPYEMISGQGGFTALRHSDRPMLPYMGWHASYLGGPEQIKKKLEAFMHHDLFREPFISNIEKNIATGADLFDREWIKFHFIPTDDPSLPQTVLKQPEKYAHFLRQV